MVYRGKPSAGCENCRKAKKRCTLEQPACTRCVKLKKPCIGYRDTSQLQIQDETQSVLQKAGRRKNGHVLTPSPSPRPANSISSNGSTNRHHFKVDDFNHPTFSTKQNLPDPDQQTLGFDGAFHARTQSSGHLVSPVLGLTPLNARPDSPWTSISNSSTSVIPQRSVAWEYTETMLRTLSEKPGAPNDLVTAQKQSLDIPRGLRVTLDEIAFTYFVNSCTSEDGVWATYRHVVSQPNRDTCLDLAVKACGMAALNNVRHVPHGSEWSRRMYTRALRLLNDSLRDPRRSRTDQCLIAVSLLGFYENLVCESMQSIQSWKAHIEGAIQLLRLRGKQQFRTAAGRQLFREARSQIMITCMWDTRQPPAFLKEWQDELHAQSPEYEWLTPADQLLDIGFEFAEIRGKSKDGQISDQDALERANDIDARLIQWSIDTPEADERWRYHELQVEESPHVWNGMVYAYNSMPAPSVWNMYRSVRTIVSRTQEVLSNRFPLGSEERRAQSKYFHTVRSQLTDDICATIPCMLGHAAPALSSPNSLVTAYNSIWPMFFAATSAFERVGLSLWEYGGLDGGIVATPDPADVANFASAVAQARWVLSRLDYIAKEMGLHWADGIASSLREAIKIHRAMRLDNNPSQAEATAADGGYLPIIRDILSSIMEWKRQQID